MGAPEATWGDVTPATNKNRPAFTASQKDTTAQVTNGHVNTEDKSITSIWLEGPDKSSTIPDLWGKDVDQIFGEIKEKYFANIDTVFKNWVGKLGKSMKSFFSKFSLKSLGIDVNKVKDWVDKGKQLYAVGKWGAEMYQEFKNGNYDAVLNGMRGIVGNGLVDLGLTGLETARMIKQTDWKNFESIMGFVSQLTGIDIGKATHFYDIQNKVRALIGLAQKYNIPEALGILRKKFGKDPGAQYVLAKGLDVNIALGQIETIDEILQVLDGPLANQLNPNMIPRLIANYRLPAEYDSSNLDKYRNQLLDVFRRIDPKWDHDMINGKKYYKLSPWVTPSADIITLFQFHPNYGTCLTIAGSYPEDSLSNILDNTYPYLNLNGVGA